MKENLYTKDCIRTFTGHYIDPFNPDPAKICIEDIAHALSMIPRFGGHLPVFYSVAEHSVMCALSSRHEDVLAALLHDASEAYLMDIPSPIKSRLPGYKEAEANLMRIIANKFGFEYPLNDNVKIEDVRALEWEWNFIMLREKSMIPGKPLVYTPKQAEKAFLKLYKEFRHK